MSFHRETNKYLLRRAHFLLVYDRRRRRRESADQLLGRRDRRKQPGGVQDESHFGRNVDESGQKRIQKSKSGQAHADTVDDQRSDKILHDRTAAAACDEESFDKLREIIADENDVCTLPRNVRTSTHSYSDSSLHKSRSVIDSVSHHNDIMSRVGEPTNEFQ